MLLRDRAENNLLLDQVQFTDTELDNAIALAVSEWNMFTPISSVEASGIPKAALLLGTASWLMRSEAFLQIRNQATYQDGEIVSIGIDDKFGLYTQFATALRTEWRDLAKNYKIQQNMEAGYGSLGSGYRWTPSSN